MADDPNPALDGATTALQRRIEELTAELRTEYERGRAVGREDVGKYSRAIGEIECVLGIAGAVPMHQTVDAVRTLQSEVARLRESRVAQLREIERLVADLATERAAREKAEAERAESQRQANDWYQAHLKLCAIGAQLKQSERERDEHAKHRANLDRKNQELSRENERLVDYASSCQRERDEHRAAREQADEHARTVAISNAKEAGADFALLQQAERERDTALARVKELEPWEKRYDKLNAQYEAQAEQLEKEYDRRVAAETALASARELPALWRAQANQYPKTVEGDYGAAGVSCCANELEAALTSHPSPAPVALHRCPVLNSECLRECESTAECELREAPFTAHCQECVELGACPAEAERLFEESGDDEPEEDAESIIERLDEALCSLLHTGGEIGEHSPRTHLDLFYAKQAESPVAAPCSGCARVRAVVARLSNAAGDVDAGFIVSKLQEALDDAPDPAQAPSNPRGTGPVPMLLGEEEP